MHLDMIYRLREAMKGDMDIIASITTSCETFDVIMYVGTFKTDDSVFIIMFLTSNCINNIMRAIVVVIVR
jgi:hypothetical protein